MSIKLFLIRLFSAYVAKQVKAASGSAIDDQNKIFLQLIRKGSSTQFGKDHHFEKIRTYDEFKSRVPIRDYEELKPYIEQILSGKKDVLWPGKPRYLAKTSGTTSGVKYIPITNDSISNHIHTARTALLNYIHQTGNADIFKGKLIFLSGSPELEIKAQIPTGRLSGIVNHEIPAWVRTNQLPSYSTNCIDDWEEKLKAIISETKGQDMRLISGIPPWVQMYYEKLIDETSKDNIASIFPNLSLFMYGGVNFEPYRAQLEKLIGRTIDSIETYPASEGFIAFQDIQGDSSLLLNTNSGIFFEFVLAKDIFEDQPNRLSLSEVEMDKDYVVIINNNAGLWAYNIGDTIRFVSLNPYKLKVSGRVKHFISAFGEHVIGKEVDEAMLRVTRQFGINITEFTVAPQVNPGNDQIPYHEWFIEFSDDLPDLVAFGEALDKAMIDQNIYYEDLRKGNILQKLVITPLRKDSFRMYMKNQGKLGGQNKVPRLSNDRKIAESLMALQ